MVKDRASTPFLGSYWVIPRKFMAGCYPGHQEMEEAHQKLSGLLDRGIRTFIDLTEERERAHWGEQHRWYLPQVTRLAEERSITVAAHRFPIRDFGVPGKGVAVRVLNQIEQSLDSGDPVYLHCWGGIGRTGTVVGCYLILCGRATPDNFIDVIARLRDFDLLGEPSPETARQIQFVKAFANGESV